MRLRFFFLLVIIILIFGCESKLSVKKAKIESASLVTFDPFALVSHLKVGSCQQLPITHRILSFSPIILENSDSDIFIGTIDVVLYSATNTYEVHYKEWPGIMNIDQTVFETKFAGNYHFEKSQLENAADTAVLEKIGTVSPVISNEKVKFFLKLETSLNRIVISDSILGTGRMVSSSVLFDDTCPSLF